MIVSRRVAALVFTAAAIPALAACNDPEITQISGNGVNIVEQDMRMLNATLVAGNPGSGKAEFLGTFFNTSQGQDDKLISITANGKAAEIKPDEVVLPAWESVPVQANRDVSASFTGIDTPAGRYVNLTVVYENAGEMSTRVLVVAPIGTYLPAAPAGTVEQEGLEEIEGTNPDDPDHGSAADHEDPSSE